MGFQTGLSGLNAASKNLDVIGNNVANSSTIGFKGARAEFSDVYAASLSGGGASQIGIGTKLSAVQQLFSQGNLSTTDNPLDMAVSGNGFFRMELNGETSYTRNGQFIQDNQGFIVNSAGRYLTGYGVDTATGLVDKTAIIPMQIDKSDIDPSASTAVNITANLDARSTAIAGAINPSIPTTFTDTTSLTVYDSLGNDHKASVFYQKTAANSWNVELYVDGANVPLTPATLTFNTNGTIATPAAGAFVSNSFTPTGAAAQTLTFDMSQVSQFGSKFGVTKLDQDGYASGRLSGFTFDSNGILSGSFTNGQIRTMGQVVLSSFPSVSNLKAVGNNEWVQTNGSGAPIDGVPNSANLGQLFSQRLEESNVDLTTELVNMITAQRVYQANAQTVKAQDSLLQTIVNLR